MNSSVFGSLQNLKDNKSKPVRDEYEYVSDEGELKIDEFPIRRKKNSRRDQSCEYLEPCQSGRPYRFFIYFNGNPDDNPVVHLAVDGFIMNIFTDFFIFLFSVLSDVREPIQPTKKAKFQPLVTRVCITSINDAVKPSS